MNAPQAIAKETTDAEGLDFAALRREGLLALQDLSGSIWTDYNVHDPGVTILEQLCFGLTELAYRSDLPPEDFLARTDGSIDYEKQALYRPEDILPSSPITDTDYRKLVLDALPEVDNLYFTWGGANEQDELPTGAYTLVVSAENWLSEVPEERAAREAELLGRIRGVLHAHRGLCERPLRIQIAQSVDCYLQGEIVLSDDSDPATALAELHFRCGAMIAARVDAQRYEEVLNGDMALEDVFNGPFTAYGHISDAQVADHVQAVAEGDLIRAARNIEAVSRVTDLRLVDATGRPLRLSDFGLARKQVCNLSLPRSRAEASAFLRLRNAGASGAPAAEIALDPLLDAAHAELLKLRFEFHSHRSARQGTRTLLQLPTGIRRELSDYYSIQQHFPPVYALGRDGLPRNVPKERKAAAFQLKAYLYPFEQLMANYLQSLEEIGPLFSVEQVERSYAAQFIGNAELPEIERLYVQDAAATSAQVPRILAAHDPVHERRGRVLDYLLAIYGEAIPQAALRRFNYSRPEAQDAWLNEVRLNLLKALPRLGRRRGGAFDCTQDVFETGNVSSLQERAALLLGVDNASQARLLSDVAAEAEVQLVERPPQPWTDVPRASLRRVAPLGMRVRKAATLERELPVLLFRHGANLANYRIHTREGNEVLCVTPDDGRTLWPVGQSHDRNTLIAEAHAMSDRLRELNRASEGLHIVEHILLRPEGGRGELPENFYVNRLSIVLPGWTARFADPNFRDFAMETLCRELPAHVLPDFYWLDFEGMRHFEVLYRNWLEHLRRQESGAEQEADPEKAGERLAIFLARAQESDAHASRYWI